MEDIDDEFVKAELEEWVERVEGVEAVDDPDGERP